LARRVVRAFTLAVGTSDLIDKLCSVDRISPELRLITAQIDKLSPESDAPSVEMFDAQGLAVKDYETVYALLPPQKKPPRTMANTPLVKITLEREARRPEWARLIAIIMAQADPEVYLKEVRALRAQNKLTLAKSKRALANRSSSRTAFNASRVAEALIILGYETMKERARNLESEGSKRKDVSEGKNQLPNSGRRSSFTVSTVRGE
jgi:hypothetical protein